VSDRIEKETEKCPVVQSLENGGIEVVKGDWRKNITMELQNGETKSQTFIFFLIKIF